MINNIDFILPHFFFNETPDIDVHKNSMGTLLYYPDSIGAG